MTQLNAVVNELTLTLKSLGYKKSKLSWYKDKNNLTVIFSVQKSQYAEDTWYYWFGICLHPIAHGSMRTIGGCQIKYRIDNVMSNTFLSVEHIAALLERWESMYGDIQLLRNHAIQGKLPVQSTISAVRYLTSIDISKL